MPLVREMTKDDAILKVLVSFRERYPDCLIVATYLGRAGCTHNFIVSINEEED